jgi:acetyltransferase-like isoleucine patch superfamily enzyme
VVGAGSVVAKPIPPDQIWAGAPARFLRNTC